MERALRSITAPRDGTAKILRFAQDDSQEIGVNNQRVRNDTGDVLFDPDACLAFAVLFEEISRR